jgi:6,7-dimethyl-8-ribityllumazine synthase
MPNVIEGQLDAKGLKFGVVVSRFNHFVTDRLLEGTMDTLVRHGAADGDVTVVRVPGSFELPGTAGRLARSRKYDAVIVLGAVIRGDTPHFDFLAAEVTKGVAQVGMTSEMPVIFGVITTDTLEQAIERAGTKSGNKGADAARAAIEMADLNRKL